MSKYAKQLTQKCSNPGCIKAFCRTITDSSAAQSVSKILSMYGDRFTCKKMHRLHFTGEKLEKNLIIDCLFYINGLMFAREKTETNPSVFDFGDGKLLQRIETANQSDCNEKMNEPAKRTVTVKGKKGGAPRPTRKMASKPCIIKPCQDLNHRFCCITSAPLSPVDSYLLIGVLHILLSKFNIRPDFNLSVIIIRLFNFISPTGEPDPSYYKTLLAVFIYVKEKALTSLVVPLFKDHAACVAGRCLFYFNMSLEDFNNSVAAVSHLIDHTFPVDFRENNRLACLFEILESLFQINEQLSLTGVTSFLTRRFFATVNLKNELKFCKIRIRSPLDYGFAIPIEIKAEVLKIQNCECMKTALQDAFFKSLFQGITQPYLFISVRRERVYQDTLRIISEVDDVDVKKQLKVKFLGEEGVDSGGIKKEYFLLISHEIENDIGLFAQTNNRLWFRKGADLKVLSTIGKLVGIALYNDVVLSVPFPSLMFKKLLGIPLEFQDLEEIEPDVYNSLRNLEKCTTEDLEFLDQSFAVEVEVDGRRVSHELCSDGGSRRVTVENLSEFVRHYWTFLTERVIEDEFKAFSDGFYSIVRFESVRKLQPCELEKIVMGVNDIDFDMIKKSTTYSGYDADEKIVEFFWEFFYDLEAPKKKRLIQFITGNDRLPVGGSKALNLIIMKNGCDTDRLPSSQTCFNTLLLPRYSTREKLREKLGKAVSLTGGFFLL